MPESIYIKNMVCDRCIMAVKDVFEKNGIKANKIDLGEVTVDETINDKIKIILSNDLNNLGFELVENKNLQTVIKIKKLLLLLLDDNKLDLKINLSSHLSENLHSDYSSISHLFSETEHTTIEKYFIQLKIEKVKELISYGELTLNEIAYRLGYSSASHLTNQFKQIVGISPSEYKKSDSKQRIGLDYL